MSVLLSGQIDKFSFPLVQSSESFPRLVSACLQLSGLVQMGFRVCRFPFRSEGGGDQLKDLVRCGFRFLAYADVWDRWLSKCCELLLSMDDNQKPINRIFNLLMQSGGGYLS